MFLRAGKLALSVFSLVSDGMYGAVVTTDLYTFSELCHTVGKNRVYVRHLQRQLDLFIPPAECGYSEAYAYFVQKIVALRTFSVPLSLIRELFGKEKRLLELLHFDTISESPTWYLESCIGTGNTESRLLLTGHELGFPVTAGVIQANLNFRETDRELFSGAEMGEDVRSVLGLYLELVGQVRAVVARESRVLRDALSWEEGAFWPKDEE